jgi:transposase
MLSLSLPREIFLCTSATDFRKSFDGLLALAQQHLAQDPLQGGLFVFFNRRRDRVKLLYWDQDGLALWQKRLEFGTFERTPFAADATCVTLSATDLALLLQGIDLASVRRRKRYSLPVG